MTIEAAALGGRASPGAQHDRLFYSSMTIAAALVVFVGFAPSYYLRDSDQLLPLPTYLRVHGLVFTMWMVLCIVQTSLVAARQTDVHRAVGWVTAALAVVMVMVGTAAGILSMRVQVEAGYGQQARAFLTTPLFSMMVFAGFVAAAIVRRRDAQTHKRLMLLATMSILDAAVARLPLDVVRTTSWAHMATTDLFLVVAVLYDVATRHTVHQAYVWGGLVLVIEQALRIPVGETTMWQSIARVILGGGA
jgi:hypothetical protein